MQHECTRHRDGCTQSPLVKHRGTPHWILGMAKQKLMPDTSVPHEQEPASMPGQATMSNESPASQLPGLLQPGPTVTVAYSVMVCVGVGAVVVVAVMPQQEQAEAKAASFAQALA